MKKFDSHYLIVLADGVEHKCEIASDVRRVRTKSKDGIVVFLRWEKKANKVPSITERIPIGCKFTGNAPHKHWECPNVPCVDSVMKSKGKSGFGIFSTNNF